MKTNYYQPDVICQAGAKNLKTMGTESKIQWTDATWNIARGCSKVDTDCKFCYMYRDSFDGTRYNPREVVKTKTVFNMPLKLKEPSKIFTCSLTDFFHEGCDSFRDEAWDIIRKCPQHQFQILTKRPERIEQCLPKDWGNGYDNVWLGTSVGSMEGMKRIEQLKFIPAKIRFISFEPLHEYIDLNIDLTTLLQFHWAIIGGESGHETGTYRYRPCKVEWIEEMVKILQGVGISVFVKQLGTSLSKQMKLTDRHGGNIDEFPKSLMVREFPIFAPACK